MKSTRERTALSRKIGKLSLITCDPGSERRCELLRSPPTLKRAAYDISEQKDLIVVNHASYSYTREQRTTSTQWRPFVRSFKTEVVV